MRLKNLFILNRPDIRKVSVEELHTVILDFHPHGLYLSREGNAWVAVDNSDGHAWTEEFVSRRKAVRWLRRLEV